MSRRTAIRAAILLLPFVVIFAGIRIVGPAFARWKRERLLPGYSLHEVKGRAATFNVWIHESRGPAEAELFARKMDESIARLTAPETGFGLVAPAKAIKIMLFESSGDLEYYAGTILKNRLVENDGFYYPPTREIGLRRGRKSPQGADPSTDSVAAGLRHEATHLLFDLAAPGGLAPWLGEGLACHFETALSEGGAPGEYGEIASEVLESGKRLPFGAVLDASQKLYSSGDNRAAYAASALIVTYLLDHAGPDLRARFLAHIASERAGGPKGRAPLERSLGLSASELEAAVLKWWTGNRGL